MDDAGGGAVGAPTGVRSSDAFVESLGPAPKKRSASQRKRLDSALADLAEVFPDNLVSAGFCAKHLVALYARLHESVYGVAPLELVEGRSFDAACSAADKLLRVEFAGDAERAVEFLRWTWRRERSVEKRRRASGDGGRRIGWRLQFALRHLLTDYRADLARATESPARRPPAVALSSHR